MSGENRSYSIAASNAPQMVTPEFPQIIGRLEPAYVYVAIVRHDDDSMGPVKIGVARDAKKRVAAIQGSCPYQVLLVQAWLCPSRAIASAVERAVLSEFEPSRIRGEWITEPIENVFRTIARSLISKGACL